MARASLELRLRRRTLGRVGELEVLLRIEAEHPREDVGREGLEGGVVVADVPVVEAACERDLVLGRGQVLGKVLELLDGLQLRVVLGDGEDRAKGAGEHVLRLRALLWRRRRARRHGRGPGFGHFLKDGRLVRGVTLHGLDEVRDEVVAPLQLDVDVRPGLLHTLTQRDEAVVGRDEEEDDRPEDDKDDDDLHHTLPWDPCPGARLAEGSRQRAARSDSSSRRCRARPAERRAWASGRGRQVRPTGARTDPISAMRPTRSSAAIAAPRAEPSPVPLCTSGRPSASAKSWASHGSRSSVPPVAMMRSIPGRAASTTDQRSAARCATPSIMARAIASGRVARPMPAMAARAASSQVGLRSPARSGSAITSSAGASSRHSVAGSTEGKVSASQVRTLPPFESAPPATTRLRSRWYVQPPGTTGGSSVASTTRRAPDVPRKTVATFRPTAPAPTLEHAPSPIAGTQGIFASAGQRRANSARSPVCGSSEIVASDRAGIPRRPKSGSSHAHLRWS